MRDWACFSEKTPTFANAIHDDATFFNPTIKIIKMTSMRFKSVFGSIVMVLLGCVGAQAVRRGGLFLETIHRNSN